MTKVSEIEARNPRQEAQSLLEPGWEARILEPSPPFDEDPQWFADDPTEAGGSLVVTPIPGEGTTWGELARRDERVRRFADEHWLDGRRRLKALPPQFAIGRQALHQLAYFALSPRRFAANGKLALRYTANGFGSPFFQGLAGGEQVRVEGLTLVRQTGNNATGEPLSTVGAACRFVGVEYRETWYEFRDLLDPIDPATPLAIGPQAAATLAAWFGFGTHVLERLRRTGGAEEVSRVQLWPEHFDLAIEIGSAEQRASYGASPGDESHAEPYLYVAAWGAIDRDDPYWNDQNFNGASLPYIALLEADDPYATALAFLGEGHRKLIATVPK